MTRETSLGAGSGLGVMFFDKPFQMALRAVKRGTERKKILKYANAKKEVSGREKREQGSFYKRESGSEMEAAFSATSSCHLFSSHPRNPFFHSWRFSPQRSWTGRASARHEKSDSGR